MKLVWVKNGDDILVGEVSEQSSIIFVGTLLATTPLANPMQLQYINMQQPSKVIANGRQQPQTVTGFRFVTIPCSEIILSHVDYSGEIKKNDPVYVTYYQVLEAVKKQAEEPLMVAQ